MGGTAWDETEFESERLQSPTLAIPIARWPAAPSIATADDGEGTMDRLLVLLERGASVE